MRAVWKAVLKMQHLQLVAVPKGSIFLQCQLQNDQIVIWFLCDPEAERDSYTIKMVGTGHVEVGDRDGYLGTVQQGMFAWHLFQTP